ncbi:MAG: UbiA family prenyltransferase [Vicinamibacterales bacterium]
MPASPAVRPALRLLHYWWPVMMGASTALVVQRATARPVNGAGFALLLAGILAAYSLDRLLDESDGTETTWLRWTLLAGAAIGVLASAILLAIVPLRVAILVPGLAVVVLGYARLKSVPVLKTLLVSAAWTWSLIALPFGDGSWFGWRAWMTPVAIPLTCLIASGCLLCDLKDVEQDRRRAVASLPVVVGEQGAIAVAVALAGVGALISLAERRPGLLVGGLAMGLAAMRPHVIARDVIGPLVVDVILTIPGLLIALHLV